MRFLPLDVSAPFLCSTVVTCVAVSSTRHHPSIIRRRRLLRRRLVAFSHPSSFIRGCWVERFFSARANVNPRTRFGCVFIDACNVIDFAFSFRTLVKLKLCVFKSDQCNSYENVLQFLWHLLRRASIVNESKTKFFLGLSRHQNRIQGILDWSLILSSSRNPLFSETSLWTMSNMRNWIHF